MRYALLILAALALTSPAFAGKRGDPISPSQHQNIIGNYRQAIINHPDQADRINVYISRELRACPTCH